MAQDCTTIADTRKELNNAFKIQRKKHLEFHTQPNYPSVWGGVGGRDSFRHARSHTKLLLMYSTESYWTRDATEMETSAKKKEDKMKETESSKGESKWNSKIIEGWNLCNQSRWEQKEGSRREIKEKIMELTDYLTGLTEWKIILRGIL